MKKLAILIMGVLFLYSCQQEKTAYVDNETLNENYSALKSSNQKFDNKQQQMQADLQKEGQAFQKKVMEYQEKRDNMSEATRQKREDTLMQEQQQLRQKQQMQQSLFMQQKQNEQDSLKNILKEKIQDYADAHNYTYIFGLTKEDNLMYAADGKNITQDILEELNEGEDTTETAVDTTAAQ